MNHNFFPLFLDMTGKKFLVYGAGKIAARRVEVLLGFGALLTLVAKEFMPEMEAVIEKEKRGDFSQSGGKIVEIRREAYRPGTLDENMDYVLAATDDKEVNLGIYRECRHREMMVNVASDQSLCDFHFPAIVETEDVIIGIASGGSDPARVRDVARRLRENLTE